MWLITSVLISLIIGYWYIWRKKLFSTFDTLDIPGPKPSIFSGNLWQMFQSTPLACIEEWIQRYGKVFGYYLGGKPTLVVADAELAKKILVKDFHKFLNRPVDFRWEPNPNPNHPFSNHLMILRDKRWKEIRSIITPSFTTSKMKSMTHVMSDAIDSMMKVIKRKAISGKCFDMYAIYRCLTMDVIGRAAFGIQTDVQNNPEDLVLRAAKVIMDDDFDALFNLIAMSTPEFGFFWRKVHILRLIIRSEGRNPLGDLIKHAKQILKHRREIPETARLDLLQMMVDSKVLETDLKKMTNEDLIAGETKNNVPTENNGSLNNTAQKFHYMADNEIIDNSMVFFIAGYDTTSTALAFATLLLIQHPEIQEKVRSEILAILEEEKEIDYKSVQKMKYLDQVMMESLRLYPPVYSFVSREASEDMQYGPYKITKGMQVQIPVYYMNHDSEMWTDPEIFNPERFSPENKANINTIAFQSFGSGPRNCIGMRFAQMEIKLALAYILSKYRLLPGDVTYKGALNLKINLLTLSPANGVNLKAVPL